MEQPTRLTIVFARSRPECHLLEALISRTSHVNMPSNSIFEFHVFVNDQALPEYQIGSDIFVEANLYSPVSYFIEENYESGCKQRYPVTPFTVRGSMRNTYSHPFFLKMSVDGQQVWMKPFPAFSSGSFKVKGYKHYNEIRELLFSLPKIVEETQAKNRSTEKACEIGTIKVECLEAISKGHYQSWAQGFRDCSANPGSFSSVPGFNHASKKDCSSTNDSVGVATREGRSIAQFVDEQKYVKTMIRYQVGKAHLGELIVKYRPRLVLEELGITNIEWKNKAEEEMQLLETNRKLEEEKQKKLEEDMKKKLEEDRKKKFEEDMKRKLEMQKKLEEDMKKKLEEDMKKKLEMKNKLEEDMKKKLEDMKKKLEEDMKKKLEEDTNDCYEKIQKMNCFSPTRNHDTVINPAKMFCFSPCNKLGRFSPSVSKLSVRTPSELKNKSCIPWDLSHVKQEIVDGDDDKQYRLIQIDDDVQMLEEIDDDVVWMGDQSCCFVDVEPPEVPMIDLSGD